MAKKLNDNQKILAWAGGGLVLCLLAGGGMWWAGGLVEEEQVAIEAERQKIQQAEAKIEKIPDLEKQVIVLRENVDTYVKILPEQGEINNFLRTVNRFVSQSNVEPKSFIDGKPGTAGKFDHYSYRIELTATLWQFLKFINLFESYERFVRVKSFTIRGADDKEIARDLAAGRDARHTISLVVETYVYRGGAAHQNVAIPNYGNKRDKLREEISFHSLQLERFEYREPVGVRDIFVDPRPRFGTGPSGDSPESVQRKIVEEFVTQVTELKSVFELWRDEPGQTYVVKAQRERQIKTRLAEVYPRAKESTALITASSLVRTWNRDVMDVLRGISTAIDPTGGQAIEGLRAEEIEELIAQMRKKLKRGDLPGAKNAYDSLVDKLQFADGDPRRALAEEATAITNMIERAIEFSDMRIEVKGVIVNEAGKSGLLVNGQVYEEGDYLDDNTLLKSVAKESAEFVFKGYSLVKTW